MLNKIKSFLLGISGLIFAGLIFLRLLTIEEWSFWLLGFFPMILLGGYGLYEIFQRPIQSSLFYVKHQDFLFKNQKLFDYLFLLSGIIVLEILFVFTTFQEEWLNLLKNILVIFFLIGAFLIGFRIFSFLKEKKEE